jgi:hypothetical protein
MSIADPGRILARSHDRVGLLFGFCSTAAFLRTRPMPMPEGVSTATMTFRLTGTPDQRKAAADILAAHLDAETSYKGGTYCATYSVPQDSGDLTIEIRFMPAIRAPEEQARDGRAMRSEDVAAAKGDA